jgi:uncharacterized protein YjbI with pentapeptide repeats
MIQPLQASRRLRLSVAVAAGLACSAAIAAEEGDIATLMATMSCENCDLSHADLSGLDLTGANLVGANLYEADMTGTILTDANLTDARYESATVRDALLCNTTDHRGDVFNRDC